MHEVAGLLARAAIVNVAAAGGALQMPMQVVGVMATRLAAVCATVQGRRGIVCHD